jgi:hypothetical protein
MDRHAGSIPSQSNTASVAPYCTPLVWGWAHGAGAAVTAAKMPQLLNQPVVEPPLLLGLPPPVRERQHGNADACPLHPQSFVVGRAIVIIFIAKCGRGLAIIVLREQKCRVGLWWVWLRLWWLHQ